MSGRADTLTKVSMGTRNILAAVSCSSLSLSNSWDQQLPRWAPLISYVFHLRHPSLVACSCGSTSVECLPNHHGAARRLGPTDCHRPPRPVAPLLLFLPCPASRLPLLLAPSVHCAMREAISAARKVFSVSTGPVNFAVTLQMDVPATMPVVKELCSLHVVERYLESVSAAGSGPNATKA